MQGPDGSQGLRGALKWLDMPPLWTLLFIALAWVQASRFPEFTWEHPAFDLLGGLMVGGGLILAALAFIQFRRASTTLIPHQEAQALVTSGIYSRSRNPIYLGDAMIIAGLCAFWGAWPALVVLMPLFIWLITDRFILPEEDRLGAAFPEQFEAWEKQTRRWI